jgi:RNA polymerase sigma-70 factor (ECF subfamily)
MIEHAELLSLLPSLKDGDSAAQKTLFDKCYPDIAGFVIKRSRSLADADEITSQAFTRCLTEIGKLKKPEQFRFWLYQLANHSLADYYRSKKTEIETVPLSQEIIETLPAPSRETDPAKIVLQKEWFEQFYKVVDKLSVDDRGYITDVLEGTGLSDMAIMRGKNVTAVKKGIHRARIRLSELLASDPYFFDDPAVKRMITKYEGKDIK